MKRFLSTVSLGLCFVIFLPGLSLADSSLGIDGSNLPALFVLPFVCMLLSIALGPIIVPNFWHNHFGKVSVFWAFAFIIPFTFVYGVKVSIYEVMHIMVLDYMPFIILLFSLFTVAGGISISGNLAGSPRINSLILLIGSIFASFMGTTGAAMLFIRPIIKANAHRRYRVHTIIFFIFTVANIGGSLTPLGDPPLFLGFLKGVPFGWTFFNMLKPMLFMIISLIIIYFIIDTFLYKKEGSPVAKTSGNSSLVVHGKINMLFIIFIILTVLMSGIWKPNSSNFSFLSSDGSFISFKNLTGLSMSLPSVCRDIILISIALLSLKFTKVKVREENDFSWEPIKEVAKVFFGIFLTMIPALAILNAGKDGALGSLVSLVTDSSGRGIPSMYFYITGILSSFLDNAPTYVVFFTLSGGIDNLSNLLTNENKILMAISCGAVFMGANTYIGNAPNFMVRAIAESQKIKMPGFFGYMLWAIAILGPLFFVLSFIFF